MEPCDLRCSRTHGEKVKGFHTGHDDKIQERLRMEAEKAKDLEQPNPKKACQAMGNDEISPNKILRVASGAIIRKPKEEASRKLEELDDNPLLLGNEDIDFLPSKHEQWQQIITEGNNLYNSR